MDMVKQAPLLNCSLDGRTSKLLGVLSWPSDRKDLEKMLCPYKI